jgi:hypothetical protein
MKSGSLRPHRPILPSQYTEMDGLGGDLTKIRDKSMGASGKLCIFKMIFLKMNRFSEIRWNFSRIPASPFL